MPIKNNNKRSSNRVKVSLPCSSSSPMNETPCSPLQSMIQRIELENASSTSLWRTEVNNATRRISNFEMKSQASPLRRGHLITEIGDESKARGYRGPQKLFSTRQGKVES